MRTAFATPEGQRRLDARIAVIWINYGPYHFARMQALGRDCDLMAIELASHQRLYGWAIASNALKDQLTTLSSKAWEDTSARELSRSLWHVLNATRPTAVLVPGYAHLPALTAALWSRCKGSIAVLMSESTEMDRPRSRWKEALKRLVLPRLFSCAIVGGKRARQYAAAMGFDQQDVVTKYDVVANDFYRDGCAGVRARTERASSGLPARYFLYVGRLAREKNIEFMLHSFSAYRNAGGQLHLVLVGQGPLDAELRAEASRLACAGSIRFEGFKDDQQLLRYYAFASCFILPSTRESWGLVVNEAAASGLPLLVSNRCGSSDDLVKNAWNGFIFDPANSKELAGLMLQIDHMSQSELALMGRRSAAMVDGYSPSDFAANVIGLLRAKLRGHSSQNRDELTA